MKIYTLEKSDGTISVLTLDETKVSLTRQIPVLNEHYAKNGVSVLRATEITPQEVPSDRAFREAWVFSNGKIVHDLQKCKTLAHTQRRLARAKEFAPLDIEATIPSKAAAAEVARQVIRDKYAVIQTQIDSASDVQTLKTIVEALQSFDMVSSPRWPA